MSFPEEPLNLSITDGGGYFPARIHQKLKADKYEVVRKLGYGPRSSTWLILDIHEDEYFAIKIFTVAASQLAEHQELPLLEAAASIDPSLALPFFHGGFWEKSDHGDHFCIVLNLLSTSVHNLVQESDNRRLPVHAVQRIIGTVANALEGLHGANLMHGAVKAENILFSIPAQTNYLKPVLDSEPAPTTVTIDKYTTVLSQPLRHSFEWDDDRSIVAGWGLYLCNFGHAQQSIYEPEKNVDYLSAPETLLENGTCSLETDIWMLGAMTYYLLTGSSPFANLDPSNQIAAVRTVVDASIDASLAHSLTEAEVAPAAAFIKACLRLDPKKRPSAKKVANHKWLETANACSCGFC